MGREKEMRKSIIPGRKNSAYLFLAPATIILLVVLLVPIFNSIRLSFFEWSLRGMFKPATFIGLRNYKELFVSENFLSSVKVTITFSLSVVSIELLLGTIFALLLEGDFKGMRLFRTLYVLPIMVAPVVVGIMWRFMYHPSYGKINFFLSKFGIDPVGWLSNPDIALISVIIADVWQWFPFVFLLVLAGLQGVPKDILEASRVDGSSYWQTLIHVKLPYIASVLGLTAILRMIDSFRSLVVIYNMTGGGPGVRTEVLSLHMYKTAFTSQRLGLASAVSVLLLLIIVLFAIVLIAKSIRQEER